MNDAPRQPASARLAATGAQFGEAARRAKIAFELFAAWQERKSERAEGERRIFYKKNSNREFLNDATASAVQRADCRDGRAVWRKKKAPADARTPRIRQTPLFEKTFYQIGANRVNRAMGAQFGAAERHSAARRGGQKSLLNYLPYGKKENPSAPKASEGFSTKKIQTANF